MIPILYDKNEKEFNTFGIGPLRDIIDPIVTEERNGVFELIFRYPLNAGLFSYLNVGNIVVSDSSPTLKNQRFVIIRVDKKSTGVADIHCEHISQYITKNTTLKPDVSFSGPAISALNAWKDNLLLTEFNFIVDTDITLESSGSWLIKDVENSRRALGGVEGSILDRYGGEYRFDNLKISLLKNRGHYKGATIKYGKNLISLEVEEEIENTVTSVQPYYLEHKEENGEQVEKIVTLPENVIHSANASNFKIPKVLVKDFTIDLGEKPTVEKLRNRTLKYMADNRIGFPKVKLSVDFADISKVISSVDGGVQEEINLCDPITIEYLKLGIKDDSAKVVTTKYNPILNRYISLEVGSLSNRYYSSINKQTSKLAEDYKSVYSTAVKALASADGKNTNYYGISTPIANNIGDLWYKDLGVGDTELRKWDGADWVLILSTKVANEAKAIAEQSKALVQAQAQEAEATSQIINEKIVSLEAKTEILNDTSTGLMTKINTQAGRILFQVGSGTQKSKIYLSKDGTYMDAAFIETAHIANGVVTDAKIANLSANKLTAGTIDATKIAVINLDASKITSGKINTDRIDTNLLFAKMAKIGAWDVTSYGTLRSENSSRVIQLDPRGGGLPPIYVGTKSGSTLTPQFQVQDTGAIYVKNGGVIGAWEVTPDGRLIGGKSQGVTIQLDPRGLYSPIQYNVGSVNYFSVNKDGSVYSKAMNANGSFRGESYGYGSFSNGSYTGTIYAGTGALGGVSFASDNGARFSGAVGADSLSGGTIYFTTLYSNETNSSGYRYYANLRNGSWVISNSDIRLKENIRELDHEYDDLIYSMPLIKYTYKSDKDQTPRVGVNANYLMKILPEYMAKSFLHQDEKTGLYGANYEYLVPYVIKAVQDLNEREIELEKRVKELEQCQK